MEGKIIKLLLGVIVFLSVLNYVESCTARKETNRALKKEIDSVNTRIEKLKAITEARRDTILYINNYQTKIIKEAEGKKDEVIKTNNMDSVVANYFKYRPNKTN